MKVYIILKRAPIGNYEAKFAFSSPGDSNLFLAGAVWANGGGSEIVSVAIEVPCETPEAEEALRDRFPDSLYTCRIPDAWVNLALDAL